MENFKLCGDPEHWINVLTDGKCWKCERELAAFNETQQRPQTESEAVRLSR